MPRILAAVLLCLTSCLATINSAHAASIPCWKVRAVIAWAGNLEAAEAIARQHGYTASEIAEARKCFRK